MAGIWLMMGVSFASDVSALGILKAPTRGGCAQAWLMPTDPAYPTPYCIDFSHFSPPQQEALAAYFDEELWIEGDYVEGALAIRRVDPALGAANGGTRAALDYHISPVAVSRSHDIAGRLQNNDASRLRIQTPDAPVSLELIFQGVQTRDQLPTVMDTLTFRLGDQVLVPETRSFGQTVFLIIPALPPQQLLVIETVDGEPLREFLAQRLFNGAADQISLTMLLSAL